MPKKILALLAPPFVALRFALAVMALFTLVMPLNAGQRWVSVSSAHFELYTTNGEKKAVEALQTFEQVRYFFQQFGTAKESPAEKVRIIAFNSESEFKPYRPNRGNFAYYQRGRERDYIVMQDLGLQSHQGAIHEYTHLVVGHLEVNMPLWLNEGMADYYSSLEPKGDRAMVGRVLPERLTIVLTQKWMDWSTLFAVDHKSPYYNESDKMSIFYSQSWALTHMLELEEGYRARFPKFLAAVAQGTPTINVFQTVYGKSIADVNKDFQSYCRQASFQAAIFNVRLRKEDLEAEVQTLSDLQVALALADLLATNEQKAEEAKARLLSLEQQNPNSPEVEVSLGYLFWMRNRPEEARSHFGLAIRNGSKDPDMMYSYAELQFSGGAPRKPIIELLGEVLKLKPDKFDARVRLGELALEDKQPSLAWTTLSQVKAVKPDQAYRLLSALAFCRLQLGDAHGAKTNVEKALKYAETAEERASAERLLTYLESSKDPEKDGAPHQQLAVNPSDSFLPKPDTPARKDEWPSVKGTTISLECVGKLLRLHVQSGEKNMSFQMTNPQSVVIRNIEGGEVNWACGPLRRQEVKVIYQPATQSAAFDGELQELIFNPPAP